MNTRPLFRILLMAAVLMPFYSVAIAQGIVIETSKFYLMFEDPCELPGKEGPTWCKDEIVRLISKSDCHESKLKGKNIIRYCQGQPDTPCEELGASFHYHGLKYWVMGYESNISATNKQGKEVWNEKLTLIHTKSPNPSFQRAGNTCVLPAAEFKR